MIEPPQVSYYFPAETGLEDKIRDKKIANTFIVPSGLTGVMAKMKPEGRWRRKSKKFCCQNPYGAWRGCN